MLGDSKKRNFHSCCLIENKFLVPQCQSTRLTFTFAHLAQLDICISSDVETTSCSPMQSYKFCKHFLQSSYTAPMVLGPINRERHGVRTNPIMRLLFHAFMLTCTTTARTKTMKLQSFNKSMSVPPPFTF